MKRLFIICLYLISFDSLFLNAQDINDKSSKTLTSITEGKEQILYFEGKHSTFTKCGLPFIYITFHDSDNVSILQGYYPFKSSFYQACWYSELNNKSGDSLFTGYTSSGLVGNVYKKDLKKIELYIKTNKWYCKIQGENRLLILEQYSPSLENETRKKLIYYEAMENYKSYYLHSNFGWKQFRSSIVHVSVDTTLLKLPYKEYCDVINKGVALKIKEIESMNSFPLPRKFYLYENNSKYYIENGKIVDNQKFFDLLKQAKPIEEPESFNPLYSIQIDYPPRGKKIRLGRMKYGYLFSNRIFTLYGYWFQFNDDISKQLIDLIK